MLVFLVLPVLGMSIFYTGYWLQHLPDMDEDHQAFASCPVEQPYYASQESPDSDDSFVEDCDMYDLVEKQEEWPILTAGTTAVGEVVDLEIHEIYSQ